MKILVIEDEHLAAEKIVKTLKSIRPDCQVLAVMDGVEKSIDWLKSNPAPDLILSDIHLSDGLCFNIYSEVKINCPIIFTTAYDKYAIKAFEVNSIDYLLKPIQSEKLEAAIDKFEQLQTKEPEDQSDLFQEFKKLLSKSEKDYKSRFLCKLGNKIKSIPTENIKYFYSKDKMTFLVDQDKNRLPVNNTLDEIDQMLDPNKFFKINRQYISSFDAIIEINPYFKGRLKLKLDPSTEDDIVVSSERSPLFKAWLNH